MYTVILTAPSLCLFTMNPVIKEEIKIAGKPSPRDIDLMCREFALRENVELDSITIDIKKDEIKPLEF